MKFDCMLFDLDGTLINTNDLVIKSFQHAFKVHLGRECTPQEVIPHFGEPLSEILTSLAPGQEELLLKTYREFNQGEHDRLTREFPGIGSTLETLQAKGVKLGVVTSKLKPMALRGLRLFDLERFFPVIVGGDDTERHKPEGEPVLKALEIMGHSKEGVLYVGDSTVDIQCAKNAGVTSAAVMWSSFRREDLLAFEPDIVLESAEDLLAYL